MLEIPEPTLQVHRVVVSAMSRHTFGIVQPSKRGIENQNIATGVAVKWKGRHLLLTAGHVVDSSPENTLRFFLPAPEIEIAAVPPSQPLTVDIRSLFELRQPRPPVLAENADLAAIILPPQNIRDRYFVRLEDGMVMPPSGTQVGVFGYPGALKIPIAENYMASPESFFDRLDAAGDACKHDPPPEFTVPYELPHRAGGYSGSGVWYWTEEPLWSPEPRLCGIVATECIADKVVCGLRIETIIQFLKDSEELLQLQPGEDA